MVTVTISKKGVTVGVVLVILSFGAGFYVGLTHAEIRVVATDPYGNTANGIVKYCTLVYISTPGDPYRRYLSFIPGESGKIDPNATYAVYSCKVQ